MAESIFAIGFLENIKVFFVAILMYAIVFSILKKIQVFGEDNKVNSLVALVSAVIVSFSGVVTYAVSYAISWFFIILFIVFLLIVILMFLGVNMGDITSSVKTNSKIIVYVFLALFAIILIKSFFALNNSFDSNNPNVDDYEIDTNFNTGIDDTYLEEGEEREVTFDFEYDSDLFGIALFMLIIGVFVVFLGR